MLGSRVRFLQEQRLSPSRGVTGSTQSSTINEFLDSSAKNYSGETLDKLTAQLSAVVSSICSSLRIEVTYMERKTICISDFSFSRKELNSVLWLSFLPTIYKLPRVQGR